MLTPYKMFRCFLIAILTFDHSLVSGRITSNSNYRSSMISIKEIRLLCPWDSPGKNTGVDCHVLSRGPINIKESATISKV
jgi:hypothetical protein